MSEANAPMPDVAAAAPPPAGGSASEHPEPSLEASAVAVKEAAILLGAQVSTAMAAAEKKLRKVAAENPYLLLGGGVGTGFVAGGGLAAPITRVLVKTGLRTAGLFLLDAAVKALKPTTTTEPAAAAPPVDSAAP
ncbi:MAG: hypothetical protein Q8O67_24330 [Deltaproteobacteria bacterium]|nr:hypothetical protein [Deltaproteobacteria bacterium]